MATKIMILNGPNLNFLGIREPHIYGPTTLKEIQASCEEVAKYLGVTISFHQSNLEGELVNWIQSAHGNYDAIITNAAGCGSHLKTYDRLLAEAEGSPIRARRPAASGPCAVVRDTSTGPWVTSCACRSCGASPCRWRCRA